MTPSLGSSGGVEILKSESVGIYAAGYGVADKSVGLICIWAAAESADSMLSTALLSMEQVSEPATSA